jgi:hypothetical protein
VKKFPSIIVLLLVFSSIFVTGTYRVEGESADYIQYSSGTTIYSPINITYNSKFLTLNLTFGVGLGVDCSLNYSIDGDHEGPIPLVAQNPTEIHIINKMTGLVSLPELSEGSHCLTVNVLCGIYDYHGANPLGSPFTPIYPNSSDYIATWAHTIYFTIDTSIPEFPLLTPVSIMLVAVLAIVIIFRCNLHNQGG